MSWHVQPFNFYLKNLIHSRFTPFIYVLPFTIAVFFISQDKLIRHAFMYIFIVAAGYLLLISYPSDKLEWYDAPLFPLFALMIGTCFATLVEKIQNLHFSQANPTIKKILPQVLLVLAFVVPYITTVKRVAGSDNITYPWAPAQIDEFRIEGAYIRVLKDKFPQLKHYTILKSPPHDPEHYDQIKFYQRSYGLQYHFSIQIKNSCKYLKTGDTVMVCEKIQTDSLEAAFSFRSIDSWNSCKVYALTDTVSN